MDLDVLRRSYERSAHRYDADFGDLQRVKYRAMFDRMPETGESRRALDLGCGTGLLAEVLRERGALGLCGVDISPAMLAFARRRGVDAMVADAQELPLRDAACDVVFAFTVLRILRDRDGDRRALSEAARVLAPNGWLGLTVLESNYDASLAEDLSDVGFRVGGAVSCGQDVGLWCRRTPR